MHCHLSIIVAAAAAVSASVCKPKPPVSSVSSQSSAAPSVSATPTGTEWATSYTATGTAEVSAAAATAKNSSPTSNVKGKSFDRFVIIWNENTDYDKAKGDPNLSWIAEHGIALTNSFAVTHPSEPNYFAAVCGDHMGMENDDFNRANVNVSTVFDLLDTKGISWGVYQEDMPFTGYEGFDYKSLVGGKNDYVRKHNPPVLFDSVTRSEERLSQIKNLSMIDTSRSMFHKDLEANTLPQWMFITPNMTSDGHDTSVTTAGVWTRNFLEPLLTNPNFMKNTLVLVTFDENETYEDQNHIHAVLIGDAVPADKVGTEDANYYNHYSELATVEANWDLPSLGRWDVGANVYAMVAEKTNSVLSEWTGAPAFSEMFFNSSYAGVFNEESNTTKTYPAPNLKLTKNAVGNDVLPAIREMWKDSKAPTYYTDSIKNNDGMHPPEGYSP